MAPGSSKQRSAIVTGGGSGIGAATAKRLVADGFAVTLSGRTKDKLDAVASEIGSAGEVLTVTADVAKPEACRDLVNAHVERFGGLDVLVNNAGVAVGGRVDNVDDDAWANVMRVNVDGVFYMTRAAVPSLERDGGGAIINVSSVSGLGGDWGMSPYNASKGAVSNFTRAIALDLPSRGIRVNAVAPSFTRTDMTKRMQRNDALMTKFQDRIPMGRGAEPEEVADVIAFLAGHDARFVNGVILPVDGGLSASSGQPNFFN
ncbi:MAG: SDR family oxidoreductase [Pseudomonadota bacterium]